MSTNKMYICFLLAAFLNIPNMFGQVDNSQIKDIRNARWGMGQPELIEKEAKIDRFNKPKIEDNVVRYENQDLDKGFRADISYKFLAGRLISAQYKVWYQSENIVGSCKNVIPFRDKVSYSEHIFTELETLHELRCTAGWYFNDSTSLRDYTHKIADDYSCTRDGKVLVRLMELASQYEYNNIQLKMGNERTKVHLNFNEWQFNPANFIETLGYSPACDDEIYNTYYWIKFEPNASLKEGISNTAMTIEELERKVEEEATEKPKKEKKQRKKKSNKKTVEPLTPVTETTLPEGAVLPDDINDEDAKKAKKERKKKAKKEKKAKKDKDDDDE
ncbi:MAG: hypothetical protein ACJAUV_000432 [Flavobacteriales bacterium]|jgi:hypothetical protein